MIKPVTQSASSMNTMQAVNLALHDALLEDPSVVLFGEDVANGEGGGVMQVTKGLSTKFRRVRVRSTPMFEQTIIGAAIGAALGGLRRVAQIVLMNFMTVAIDQLVNHAAKLRFMPGGQTDLPMTVRTMPARSSVRMANIAIFSKLGSRTRRASR